MKVRMTGLSTRHPDVQVPDESRPGHKTDHITVQNTRVVRVDELCEWCLSNSETTVGALAVAIARGDFG
jgi:hypothetical protein